MFRSTFTPAMILALAQSISIDERATTLTQTDMLESELAPENLTLAKLSQHTESSEVSQVKHFDLMVRMKLFFLLISTTFGSLELEI